MGLIRKEDLLACLKKQNPKSYFAHWVDYHDDILYTRIQWETLSNAIEAFSSEVDAIEVVRCKDCSNYVALNISDQFGNIVKHTGRGYCKHISQRGERHDDDWCKWGEKKGE